MTQQDDKQEQTPTAEQVAGVLLLLQSGASITAIAQSVATFVKLPVAALLPVLLMMRQYTKTLVSKSTPKAGPGVQKPLTPTQITSDANNLYRAAFLVNSSRRVAAADDPKAQLERERAYWQAHVAASNRRMMMAKAAEEAQKKYGWLLVGWHATIDARTSDECRAAHGRNFDPTDPPYIGYPGAVHLFCRCVSGPPFPGAKLVDQSSIVRLSPEASGFEKRSGNG